MARCSEGTTVEGLVNDIVIECSHEAAKEDVSFRKTSHIPGKVGSDSPFPPPKTGAEQERTSDGVHISISRS